MLACRKLLSSGSDLASASASSLLALQSAHWQVHGPMQDQKKLSDRKQPIFAVKKTRYNHVECSCAISMMHDRLMRHPTFFKWLKWRRGRGSRTCRHALDGLPDGILLWCRRRWQLLLLLT